ncbi:Cystatin-F [Pitangus sulphuratus]|nr:Cystatin-F [Pitangus sulphuratus]
MHWTNTHVPPPHSTMKPGSPIPVNINSPGVRKAARFGVYRYNNSSNDLFLFKDSQINKAMVQIVRGLKYMLHVEIKRTVCEKREHSSLDSCHFQRKKNLQQTTDYIQVQQIDGLLCVGIYHSFSLHSSFMGQLLLTLD